TASQLASLASPISPPRYDGDDHDHRKYICVHMIDDPHQPLPLRAEEIAYAGNGGDPGDGAKKIKKKEAPPRHAQHACHRPGNDPHAENEAREKDSGSAVALEELFAALQCGFTDAE